MSDDSRRSGQGGDEAPVELDEARQARELAEAMDARGTGAPDPEALEAAALLAAARKPELSPEARARIGDELFGPAVAAQPRRHSWAIAAGVLVAVGSAALLTTTGSLKSRPAAAPPQQDQASAEEFHRKADLLIAEMMPQPTPTARARAIADVVEARLKEAAP